MVKQVGFAKPYQFFIRWYQKDMQQITKYEAEMIRKNLRGVHVTTTNRYSNAKKKSYYTEESPLVSKFLARLRSDLRVSHFE